MKLSDIFKRKKAEIKKPARPRLFSEQLPGPYVDIVHSMQWQYEDGSIKEPLPEEKKTMSSGNFTAAGKHYSSLAQLSFIKVGEYYAFKDIYGRDVLAYKERFPCFDSYDRLYENRYYRWFYIRSGESLTCVYYRDEGDSLELTEKVHRIRQGAWEAMKEINWLGSAED